MESTVQHILPVKAEISSDMAPFSLPVAFPNPRCISNGQLTPPLSPLAGVQGSGRPCVKQKRQNINLIVRLPRVLGKTTHCTKISRSKQQHDSDMATLNELHSRGVESRTPHQQSLSGVSATIEHPTTSDESPIVPPVELRRIPQSYYDLRGLAQEHEKETHLALPIASPLHTPLLPSPVFREPNMMSDDCLATSYRFENPRRLGHRRNWSSYKSYDDMQIISCYEVAGNSSSENIAGVMQRSSTMPNISASQTRENIPELRPTYDERPKLLSTSTSASGESDWLANTTSHQQRLRKFKARCYQVVQHPFRANAPKYEEEGKVMLATVLVGPGKPKLVQIQRPASSNNSFQSSQTSSDQSAPSVKPFNSAVWSAPSTPILQTNEISAFSPYDTPSVVTPFVDASRMMRNKARPPVEQTPISASKLDLVPRPLDFAHQFSSDSEESIPSATERTLRSLTRNFSLPSPSKTPRSNRTTWTDDGAIYPGPTQSKISPRQARRNRLERKLDAITTAIDNFPNTMLDMNSCIVTDLRVSPTERKNRIHIDNLSRVFIDAPKQLLSSLAAWVVVDSYVSGLHFSQDHIPARHHSRGSSKSAPSRKSSAKNKTAHLEAIKEGFKTSRELLDGPFPLPPTTLPQNKPYLDHDDHFFESNDTIHLIPLKARSILGLDQQNMWQPDENLLVTRARALSLSIGVVAQKMVEVLKGEGGWDPYLWRALSVVVGTVEESDI